ncbi:MAG: hypothetical protein Q8T03_02875 [Bacteroidota bacterium]|nr:hypothetical protein [Bacteroidota bacterium]
MAESILRASNKLFEDKQIKSWHSTIKKLEDYLGEIENYIEVLANFSKLKTIKVQQLEYISNKLDKAIDKLNKKLSKNDFYLAELERMNKEFKINFNDKAIVLKLQEEIKSELIEACNFFNQFPKGFDDMEEQVHELRRKLRWISIYGESFQGLIVLKDEKTKYVWEKNFITTKEIKSPFNKLPIKKNLSQHILLNKKAFYALSFMISNLGIIKDKGLGLYTLEKSIRKTDTEKGINSSILASKQLDAKFTQESLLKEAHILSNNFFNKHKIHEILI